VLQRISPADKGDSVPLGTDRAKREPVSASYPLRFKSKAVSIDVLRRARWLMFTALLVTTVVSVPLALFLHRVYPHSAFKNIPFLALFAHAIAWVVTLLLPRLRSAGPAPGALAVDGDALAFTVGRRRREPLKRRVRLDDIRAGYRTDDEVRLEIRRGEVVAIAIERAEEGEAILRAVGHDAQRRVLEVSIASMASRFPGVPLFLWLSLLTQVPALVMIVVILWEAIFERPEVDLMAYALAWALVEGLFVVMAARFLSRRIVRIGNDGIVFRRFLRARFYPYASIADVSLVPGGVSIALRSGRRLKLRARGFWSRGGIDPTSQVLHERIHAARSAATSAGDVQAKLPLLERRGRAPGEWLDHLASLVGKAGYRMGAVTVRDLEAVLDDNALSPEHRVAAALALSAADPDEARVRVRVAVEACADHDLRVALEHAAEGEVDEARLGRLMTR
jgi:hypothetical protein